MKLIKIRYMNNNLKPLEYVEGKSDWIDLRAGVTMHLEAGNSYMIPLGIAMEIPKGYEAHIVPRSSTFKNYGIIQTNSVGIIDNSYSGDDDQWYMPVYATRDTTIHFNDRICQFRIFKNQPLLYFLPVKYLGYKNRGGFGSTGKQ